MTFSREDVSNALNEGHNPAMGREENVIDDYQLNKSVSLHLL